MVSRDVYFIGIDAGTSVIKSVLFDEYGKELSSAQRSVPVESSKQGWQETNMNKVWEAALETTKTLLQKNESKTANVKAIGITGQGCGVWLIDKNGNPFRNAILWSDTRSADIVNQWLQSEISQKVYKLIGCDLFSGSQGSILKWLSIHEPESLKQAEYSLYCKDWIKFKLTGVISTDPSETSISYLDFQTDSYSEEALHLMGIEKYRYLLP